MPTTLIHSAELTTDQRVTLSKRLVGELQDCGGHFRIQHASTPDHAALEALRAELHLDINTLPADFDPASVGLLITDMDSTLISIECVDEIADFVGVKPQVAAITEAAMRGEINFEASLRQRVALLEGLSTSALQQVYDDRLRLNPGAETLIDGLKARGIKLALVSGGFTFFTDRLKTRLGLDFTLANVLAEKDSKLLGSVEGAIVGAETKATYLTALCHELEIHPAQVVAIGDGANDLKMLAVAGLGVAYHAKPAVRAQADAALHHRGLDAVLDMLNAMGGDIYQESGNSAILLAIPSRLLSGAAYIHIYDWANARASIAGDNLTDPTNPQYASRIEHRGAQVLENGITAAKSISGTGWRRQLAVGFNVKFLFIEGYGYSEDVRDAKTRIDRNQYSSSAAFNLDIGVLKEFGVWKLGLMAKNLLSGSFEYGDTGDYFDIAPQLRAGFAYQSRRTVFELDLDLTRNQAAGFDSVTQMAALGVEFKPWRWLALRSGYQQNLLGTQVGTASLGLGAAFGLLTLGIAVSHSEEQDGAHAQLGFQF